MDHQTNSPSQKITLKLTLLRHGETRANRDSLVLGTDTVPLTKIGIEQSIKAARRIAQLSISTIYCSPLLRTTQTASYVTEETGIPSIELDGLREMDSGEMEGIKMDEMRIKYPEYMQKWDLDPSTARPPGGDTMEEVHKRTWDSVLLLSEYHRNEHILAVSHLFPIQGILCNIAGMHSNNYKNFKIELGSLTTVRIEQDKKSIINISETSHLDIT